MIIKRSSICLINQYSASNYRHYKTPPFSPLIALPISGRKVVSKPFRSSTLKPNKSKNPTLSSGNTEARCLVKRHYLHNRSIHRCIDSWFKSQVLWQDAPTYKALCGVGHFYTPYRTALVFMPYSLAVTTFIAFMFCIVIGFIGYFGRNGRFKVGKKCGLIQFNLRLFLL